MNQQQIVDEIKRLIRGWTNRSDEQRILELLAMCEGPSLDMVLMQLNQRALIRNLHNRWRGAKYRSDLVQLLTVDRIHDLSLETRAEIVRGLQKGSTRRSLQIGIRNIILASTGEELRQLRNTINTSDSHRDLSRLIFVDVDDDDIRTEILDHIAAHQSPTDELKVLSDIDDTVFARLHDRRYPGKTRYPGVLAFFNVLDHAPDGQGEDGDLTFVTARPGLLTGLIAMWTRRTLRNAGIHQHTILTGSLFALRSHAEMAKRKLRNIRRYHQLFPEYGLVFVGDSGQGDVQVGREMVQELGEVVRGVFIHDVNETSLNQPKLHYEFGINYFDTYIAAAAAAWERGVISADQAVKVGNAAIADLEKLIAIPPKMREDRLAEHHADFATLRQLIAAPDTG